MREDVARRGRKGLRLWPRSLRWRLQLWQGFLAVVMMAGFGATIYELQRVNRFRQIDAGLETRVTAISRAVREVYRDGPPGPPPDGPSPGPGFGPPPWDRGRAPWGDPKALPPPTMTPPEFRAPPEVVIPPETSQLFGPAADGFYFTIWFRNGAVLNRSANAPLDSPRPSPAERDTLPHYRLRGGYREIVHCSGFGDCAMAGRSVKADLAASQAFGWTLLGAGAAILVLSFGLGWQLIGRAIRPIDDIGNAATRIAQGNLSERISVGDLDDELGRLAGVLNSTFARLEAAFVRQQQFTSNAAHELRTPLAILISEAQTTLARERTASEYRETVEGGLETAQRMRKITETLLELARFDAADSSVRGESVPREAVDLAEVAARCVERLEPAAQRDGIPILRDLAPAQATVSPERVEVVIANLLTNALYYNRLGGRVTVATYRENGSAVLKVSDTGIGIAAEDIPHIFDRFYRADKARSRSQGHTGLGLAICKTIVEAERGEITVFSAPREGAAFTVRFPSERA